MIEEFELYNNIYKHGKVGELDVWNASIKKNNIMYYRIYKTDTKWVLFIRQKNKQNKILYENFNLGVNNPPLNGWEKTIKIKTILVYTIGSLNILQGCANNTINLCILLSKINSVSVHLLLHENININVFSNELLKTKNIKIYQPSNFNLKIIDHTNYSFIINKLDNIYNYTAYFIRTAFNVKQQLPDIKKSIFFIHYTNASDSIVLNKINNIFFSNKIVMDYCLSKFNLDNKKCIEIFPMVRSIGECNQTLSNNIINVCYLGSFKKDYLVKEFLNVFKKIKMIKNFNIFFYIYGSTFKDSSFNKQTLLTLANSNDNNIIYNGHIKNENIEKVLKNMHFGLSVRSEKFDNHLDLSSKLLDYTRNGVIPLCNKAKINEYILGNKFNGYVSKPEDILNKILYYINNQDIYTVDKNISISGSKKLLHENYIPVITEFINNL